MTTTNIDLFEKPLYTVHVNGLFGVITKASVTEKIVEPHRFQYRTQSGGRGLFEQIREGNVHQYERMTEENFRAMMSSLDRDSARGREANVHIQDEAGQFPTINMNGETFDLPANPGTSLVERMVPYQHTYDIMMARIDQEIARHRDNIGSSLESQLPDNITNREVQQLLQTRLRNGEITQFEYLDAISNLDL